MKRSAWPWILVGLSLVSFGCAKRVPSPDLQYEAHQRAVLTFQSGLELEGRVAEGKRVELREGGVTWNGTITKLTDEEIVLGNLVQVRTDAGIALQTARVADTRYAVGEVVTERRLPRSEIAKVDLVKMDLGKTARTAGFWTYGAVVLTLLVGERS